MDELKKAIVKETVAAEKTEIAELKARVNDLEGQLRENIQLRHEWMQMERNASKRLAEALPSARDHERLTSYIMHEADTEIGKGDPGGESASEIAIRWHKERDELVKVLTTVRNELGVPGDGYPMNVANASEAAQKALHDLAKGILHIGSPS